MGDFDEKIGKENLIGCGNGSDMGTFVLVFEYLDVNTPPIYW